MLKTTDVKSWESTGLTAIFYYQFQMVSWQDPGWLPLFNGSLWRSFPAELGPGKCRRGPEGTRRGAKAARGLAEGLGREGHVGVLRRKEGRSHPGSRTGGLQHQTLRTPVCGTEAVGGSGRGKCGNVGRTLNDTLNMSLLSSKECGTAVGLGPRGSSRREAMRTFTPLSHQRPRPRVFEQSGAPGLPHTTRFSLV